MACLQNFTVKERSIFVFAIKNIFVKQAFTIIVYSASQEKPTNGLVSVYLFLDFVSLPNYNSPQVFNVCTCFTGFKIDSHVLATNEAV
jgi:hypothetical protein